MAEKTMKYADDILDIQDFQVVSYKGKEPFQIRNKIEEIMKKELEINAAKFFLHTMGWDVNEGAFKAEWHAYRSYDRWTKVWFFVRIWGWQNLTPDKEGWAKIKTWAEIHTEYTYSNSIQKSLWWTYSYMFYDKNRRQILEDARERYFRIIEDIRQLYGMSQKHTAEAAQL